MAEQELVFELTELEVGKPLKFDLQRADGQLLAKSGGVITQQMIADWARQGITSGRVIVEATETDSGLPQRADLASLSSDVAADTGALLELYDEAALRRLDQSLTRASAATLNIANLLARDRLRDCREITNAIETFILEVELDIATVLAALALRTYNSPTDKDRQLATRSARLSAMAVVLCNQMGLSREECHTVGLAGMLHDLALFDQTRSAVDEICGKQENEVLRYHNHSLHGAGLLTYVGGVSERARDIMTQVHEEPSGQGFPLGLTESGIDRLAKVLNLVDAYFTLTATDQPAPLPPAANLIPADALAYLMHHAAKDHFEISIFRALVRATSLYPVGSHVELSDSSTAVVLRSTQTSPFEPIVRMDAGLGRVVDMRSSNLTITRPIGVAGGGMKRIAPSKLNDVLWRSEFH